MRNLGFDALLDREIEEHFGEKPMKRYTATVIISYAIDVDAEAQSEEEAKDMMYQEAFGKLHKYAAESELFDFTEET